MDVAASPRIYVDFNDLGPEIGLAYNGTLRDLSQQKIRLRDGMALVLYDEDGDEVMEVQAVAQHQPDASSNPQLQWRAHVDLDTFRRSVSVSITSKEFHIPCFTCGVDVYRRAIGRKLAGMDFTCANCSARVLEPYLIA